MSVRASHTRLQQRCSGNSTCKTGAARQTGNSHSQPAKNSTANVRNCIPVHSHHTPSETVVPCSKHQRKLHRHNGNGSKTNSRSPRRHNAMRYTVPFFGAGCFVRLAAAAHAYRQRYSKGVSQRNPPTANNSRNPYQVASRAGNSSRNVKLICTA